MLFVSVKNILHNKTRLLAAVVGIGFGNILAFVIFSALIGYINSAANFVDLFSADIWITESGKKNILSPSRFEESVLHKLNNLGGISTYSPLILQNATVKINDYHRYPSLILAADPEYLAKTSFNYENPSFLNNLDEDNIYIDRSALRQIGSFNLPSTVLINDIEYSAVGFTSELSTVVNMQVSPIVITSVNNGYAISRLPNMVNFGLIKLQENISPVQKNEIHAYLESLSDRVSYFETHEFKSNTRNQLIISGVGQVLVFLATIVFLISLTVSLIMTHTRVLEGLHEFGTLRAIGANKPNIYTLIVSGAFILHTLGFTLGLILSYLISFFVNKYIMGATLLDINGLIIGIIGGANLLMTILSSFMGIRQIIKTDPSLVFRLG